MTTQALLLGGEVDRWEQAIYAFLAEKERRSDSGRTVQAYSRMLYHFFGALGKTPDEVSSQEVFAYAHSIGLSGRKPTSVKVAARIACLSSFYRFLIRMEMVTSNPCDKLERPKATTAPPPEAWSPLTFRGYWRSSLTPQWGSGTGPSSWC